MICKGDLIRCIADGFDENYGFAVYKDEVYEAALDEFEYEGKMLVQLVQNGDYEPYTCYLTEYFEIVQQGFSLDDF